MRGLYKLSAVENNLQARRDWVVISKMVESVGHPEIIEKHTPPENASYRKIDRCIAQVKKDLESYGLRLYRDLNAESAHEADYYKVERQ